MRSPPSRCSCGAESTPDGVPFLDPVFVIDAPPALPRSIGDYVVSGRTGDGTVLFSLDFEMPEVADGDGSSSFVFVLPAESGWEGALASVTLTGPGGSVTVDRESSRPMAILRDPGTGRIQGILRDLPPTVMTQAIADTAVLREPGLEVLFSRGIPARGPGGGNGHRYSEAESWRRPLLIFTVTLTLAPSSITMRPVSISPFTSQEAWSRTSEAIFSLP